MPGSKNAYVFLGNYRFVIDKFVPKTQALCHFVPILELFAGLDTHDSNSILLTCTRVLPLLLKAKMYSAAYWPSLGPCSFASTENSI
jgi:hypothetical protein